MISPRYGRMPSRLHGIRSADCDGICCIADGSAGISAFLQAADRLLDECVAGALLSGKPRHGATVRRHCSGVIDYLAANTFETLQTAISAYLGHLRETASLKTVHNHRWSISLIMDQAVSNGIIDQNPCRAIRIKTPPKRKPKYLTPGEIETTVSMAQTLGCGNEVILALTTGLRLGELQRLTWADVDANPEKPTLYVAPGKTGQDRIVPLCSDALKALANQRDVVPADLPHVFPARQTWRGGMRYLPRMRGQDWWLDVVKPIQQAVPKFLAGAASNETGRFWHTLRHTFASVGVQRGVSLYKVQGFLGHDDPKTTEKYAHLLTGYDPDIERINPLNNTPNCTTCDEIGDAGRTMLAAAVGEMLELLQSAGVSNKLSATARAAIKQYLGIEPPKENR